MDIDKNQSAAEFKYKHGRGENVTRHLETVEDYESEEEEYDSGCEENSDSEWKFQMLVCLRIRHNLNCCPFSFQ